MNKSDIVNRKFVETWNIDNFEIETDTGWEDIRALHKTIPYLVYKISTKNGLELICADDHIVFLRDLSEIFAKDLKINDEIITKMGIDTIISVTNMNIYENMYDFELSDSSNHRYYTNDILSHNTLLAKSVAKMLDVPFAIADATVLTEAGYVGEDVETVITRLLQASDYDVKKAEHGVVLLDEVDKIARKGGDNPSITRDVSGEGVQQGLLKLLEGSIVQVPPKGGRKHPDAKMVAVDTKDILFICAGAFEGIDKIISRRLNTNSLGFNVKSEEKKERDSKNMLHYVNTKDLRQFGLIPELIGRIPVVTYLDPLTEDDLKRILTEPKNAIIKQFKKLFELDDIELIIDDEVYDYIVKLANKNKLGARGLRSIVETLMNDAMFNMPGKESGTLHIDIEYAKEKLKEYEDTYE